MVDEISRCDLEEKIVAEHKFDNQVYHIKKGEKV